tara:strand:- start:77 stop:1273 length:1197 start_codon:yes stop_codon:yes gene_type:complete
MNLSEKIALDCGVKLNKPFIDKFFYPVVDEKYIIIDSRSTFKEGVYDYYKDVVELVEPYFSKNNIEIYQLADDSSLRIKSKKCFIKINKKQENYIIDKSQLVLSNENYTLYVASALNKKSIGLYSVFNPSSRAPIWNKNNQIILESDRFGNKPSYNTLSENPKAVNLINPYEVAKNILDSLKIKNNLDKYDLVFLGRDYNQKIVEVIPDFISDENFLQNQSINLRLDYIDDLDARVLLYWLKNRKVNIITNKDLNIDLLKSYRQNIVAVTAMASESITTNFVKLCKSIGVKINLYCDNKEKFKDHKFKFLDWELEQDFSDEEVIPTLEKFSKSSKYHSSKIIISKGKKYPCKAAFLAGKTLDINGNNAILNKEFEKEIEFFKIFNVKNHAKNKASVKK